MYLILSIFASKNNYFAMAITTTSFEIIFKLASKEFQITDIAPYPGADLADISTSIIITDPSGDVSDLLL